MPDDVTERHLELWCGPVRSAVEAPLQPTRFSELN